MPLASLAAPSESELPDRLLRADHPSACDRETVRGSSEALILVPRADSPTRDPQEGSEYRAACHVYLSDNGLLVRRFVVHAPDREAVPIARRCARMLAILWSAVDERLGRTAMQLRARPVHVWLARSGAAGGRQIRSDIYFYDLYGTRSGLEWAREIAHEYGHYMLASPSGYAEPESWANGTLGERLFLKWLLDDIETGVEGRDPLPFASRSDLEEYRARQVAPLLARMRAAGADVVSLARTDRDAFDNFTGLMLYVDDIYGGRILTDFLDFLSPGKERPVRGDDFLSAFLLCIDGRASFSTRLAAGRSSRVYVPVGSYTVRPAVEGVVFGKGLKATPVADGWSVRSDSPGWREVRVPAGATVTLTWDRAGGTRGGSATP